MVENWQLFLLRPHFLISSLDMQTIYFAGNQHETPSCMSFQFLCERHVCYFKCSIVDELQKMINNKQLLQSISVKCWMSRSSSVRRCEQARVLNGWEGGRAERKQEKMEAGDRKMRAGRRGGRRARAEDDGTREGEQRGEDGLNVSA